NGADQGEIALMGARENQPPIAVLEHVDVVGIEQSPDHDLACSDRVGAMRWLPQYGFGNRSGPGPAGVDQGPGSDDLTAAAVDRDQPPEVAAVGADAACASTNVGPPFRGIDGVGDHQPR